MKYNLKPLNESNNNIDVLAKKNAITEKYKSKLYLIRAKIYQLQTEYKLTVQSYQEELKKVDEDLAKSIEKNVKANPFHTN